MRLLMLPSSQHLVPYIDLLIEQIVNPNAYQTLFKQCQTIPIQEAQKCFVLMQRYLMLNIFVCDAWQTSWIYLFENFCPKSLGTTMQDVHNLPNNIDLFNLLPLLPGIVLDYQRSLNKHSRMSSIAKNHQVIVTVKR